LLEPNAHDKRCWRILEVTEGARALRCRCWAGDSSLLFPDFGIDRTSVHGLEVQWRQPPAQDVDDAVSTFDAKMVGVGDILRCQKLVVGEADGFDVIEKPVGDNTEAADPDVAKTARIGISDDPVEVRTRRLVREA
jgi:hypothetical protein